MVVSKRHITGSGAISPSKVKMRSNIYKGEEQLQCAIYGSVLTLQNPHNHLVHSKYPTIAILYPQIAETR
jgi:hypothetical protein